MKKRIIKVLLFIIILMNFEINGYAENICRFSENRSSGGSLKPGTRNSKLVVEDACCKKNETSIPHVTLDFPGRYHYCVSCGTTPCRLCKSTDSVNGNEYIAVPDVIASKTEFSNSKNKSSVTLNFNGSSGKFYTKGVYDGKPVNRSYSFTCEQFQYADTDYEHEEVNGVCREYLCEPRPLSVCWIKEQNGVKEYNWSDTRPGGSEWQANFNLTKEECLGIITQDVPKYCFVKYGTNTSNNEYKVESSATSEWQKVNENEYGSEECNSDLICKECNEEPKCYKNNQDELVWGKYRNRVGYTLQSDKNRNECNSVVICNPTSIPISGSNVAATKCEDTVSKTYQTKISCNSADRKGFYEITCTTTVKPTFDLDDDRIANSELTILKGQGFGFGIRLEVIKTCEGKFNSNVWNSVYNIYKNQNGKSEEEAESFKNIISRLEEKVTEFNNWNLDDKFEIPDIELKLLTNPNVNINKMNYEIVSNGVVKKIPTATLELASGTTVDNFKYTNEDKPRYIMYFPPKVYLDKITGGITTNKNNVIDGGYKVYSELNTEVKNANPIEITISNLEDNKVITNNKCLINIVEPKSLYRIVDVNNPFVNSSRDKPKNWLNGSVDYTTIIDGMTESGHNRLVDYKKNPLYTFNLKKSEIEELKHNNEENGNDYLGTCSGEVKNPINIKICEIINAK